MKRMLFLYLLLPLAALSQPNAFDLAYWKYKPDSLKKQIHMPPRDYNPDFKWESTPNARAPIKVHVINTDTVYKQLFFRYIYTNEMIQTSVEDPFTKRWMKAHHVDSLPEIDFSKYELLLYVACEHCLAYCKHDEMGGTCHRQACGARESWFIREKKSSLIN